MTTQSIKEVIKTEYIKCAKDPKYFLTKYAIIQHPVRGKVHFDLYNFQSDTLDTMVDERYVIILKARQLGISTLVAGYSLWMMLFHSDKNVLVIATKQETAKNLVTKVRVMHENLPVWLRGNCIEDNKLSLRFANGSQIKAIASSEDAGRSEALSLLILDEAAFIEDAEVIWKAASSTISTGGQAILLSTPNGMGNFFHKEWVKSNDGTGMFKPIVLHWSIHPERDDKWREEQTAVLGDQGARQEHDCDFIASGNTVINGDLIQFYRETFEEEPKLKRGFDANLWVWEESLYGKSYVVVADVARGDGSDKSAFHVIELESVRQVAEYRGLIGTKEFGAMLIAIATEYNDALLVIENGGVGWAVIQEAIDREYKNLFYMTEDLKYVDPRLVNNKKHRQLEKKSVPGFTTSQRTRPLVISKLDEYMRDTSVVIHSKRTFEELQVFIWNGSRAEAMDGYNDDLVMSLSIGLWIRDTALKLRQQGIELTKLALNKFQHKTSYDGVYTVPAAANNMYEMDLGRAGKENLRWLLDE